MYLNKLVKLEEKYATLKKKSGTLKWGDSNGQCNCMNVNCIMQNIKMKDKNGNGTNNSALDKKINFVIYTYTLMLDCL